MTYIPNQEAYNKIVSLIDEGNQVTAIRFVRDDGKIKLKEAKQWVEDFIQLHFRVIYGEKDG